MLKYKCQKCKKYHKFSSKIGKDHAKLDINDDVITKISQSNNSKLSKYTKEFFSNFSEKNKNDKRYKFLHKEIVNLEADNDEIFIATGFIDDKKTNWINQRDNYDKIYNK